MSNPLIGDELTPLTQLINDSYRIAGSDLLTFDQEKALARRLKGEKITVPPPGDPFPTASEAESRLIASNTRLVFSVARKYVGRGVGLDDLVQEGLLGLYYATKKYDPDRGFRFSTYVTWWIRQSVIRCVQNTSNVIRLPVHVDSKLADIARAEEALTAEFERNPTLEEVSALTGLSVEEIILMKTSRTRPLSLDSPVSQSSWDNTEDLGDIIPANGPGIQDRIDEEERMTGIRYALSLIPSRERAIIALRFGIDHDQCHSLHESGAVIGVTRERARQLEEQGLRRIRNEPHLLRMFSIFKEVE